MAIPNSYAGRLTSKFKTSAVLLEIKKATVLTPPHGYNEHILLVTENMSDVQSFVHPLLDEQTGRVYIDARPYTLLERDGTLRIRNEADYELNIMRAKMELIWNVASRAEISAALEFSNEVFVRWLSELISFKYKLQPQQTSDLIAVCALYNVGQYHAGAIDDRDVNKYVQKIAMTYHLDANRVFSIYDQVGTPGDLEGFVSAIHDMKISPRLEDLNALTISHAIGGSWFISVWSADIVSLALEYPPAFSTLVFMAMKYKMFKRSAIGERVERMNRRGNWEDFSRSIQSLFDRYINEGAARRNKHGFEDYDDFPDYIPTVGAEASWGQMALGGGAAVAVLFLIYKVYSWITGGGSGGGGGGGSATTGPAAAVKKVEALNNQVAEEIKKGASASEATTKGIDELTKKANEFASALDASTPAEALPEQLKSQGEELFDKASTPLQAAVVAKVVNDAAKYKDPNIASVRLYFRALGELSGTHMLTDEEFISAAVAFNEGCRKENIKGPKLLSGDAFGEAFTEEQGKYMRDILTSLKSMPTWAKYPIETGALINGCATFQLNNYDLGKFNEVLGSENLSIIYQVARETQKSSGKLILDAVNLLILEARDQMHGKISPDNEKSLKMLDTVSEFMEKKYNSSEMRGHVAKLAELRTALAACSGVTTAHESAVVKKQLELTVRSGGYWNYVGNERGSYDKDIEELISTIESVCNDGGLNDAVGELEKLIDMHKEGKFFGKMLTGERLVQVRKLVMQYGDFFKAYIAVAAAHRLKLQFHKINTGLVNAHIKHCDVFRDKVKSAIKAIDDRRSKSD